MYREKGNTLEIILILLLIALFIFITLFFFLRIDINIDGSPTGPNDTKPGSTDVKVDLLGSDGSTSIVGKTIPFILQEGQTEIICQPGETYITEPFYVKNKGDITIDYIVSISEGNSVEARIFKEAFDFWLTTDPATLTEAIPIFDYRGVLNSGESSIAYYLVISMKTSADNTYQGKTFETVGITITAMEHGRSGQE